MTLFRDNFVYRLLAPINWEMAKVSGHLPYAEVDHKDGFFHLSAAHQVLATARLHYKDHVKLVAAGGDGLAMGADLKWEASRGGELFPHYFGFLPVGLISHLVFLEGPSPEFRMSGEQEWSAE